MLTTRKKLRNRKQLYLKISLLTALFVVTIVVAYFTSLKLFGRPLYISPLAQIAGEEFSYQDDKNLDLLKKGLTEKKIEFISVNQQGASYRIVLKDNTEVILSTEKDMHSQISSLQFILSRLTMEGKLFTQLDLRFDKPVIKLRK